MEHVYGVWAVRSAASMFGHAEAWCKEDGRPLEFESLEAAQAYALELNRKATVNVRYFVKEKEPEPNAVRVPASQPDMEAVGPVDRVPRNDVAEKHNEIPGRQMAPEADPVVEIRSAVHSNYANMVAMLAADNKVYLGREEHYSFIVTLQADAKAVLDMDFRRYDLILLDVMMPDVNGFELCNQIRSRVDCPIIFLTAKTQESDIVRGLGIGGDDYITKPFGTNELLARVNAHLRRDTREKKYAVSISGILFHINAKEAEVNGNKLPLTKSEYEICEYLALHRGQVFSREQIYEAVFGFDGESDDSVIATHIKNIRSKLAAVKLSPIETVWGVGYKWE